MSSRPGAELSAERPFPGLRPFVFEDHKFFFGRREQTYALYRLLDRSRFVAVVGSSGSGKSSLVRAGLLPLLEEENKDPGGRTWRWIEMQPGGEPLTRLIDKLADALRLPADSAEYKTRRERMALAVRQSSFGIAEAISEIADREGKSFVIVVDQFEELFRFADPREDRAAGGKWREEATHFVQLLLESSRDRRHDLKIVITMRSDFIGDCAQFYGLPEAVSANQFLVPGLTRDQREEVIREPLEEAGASIEPPLVERLLNDIGGELDQLPVLQHCLLRLWESAAPADPEAGVAPKGRHLTLDHYEKIGGIEGALSEHADAIFAELKKHNFEWGIDRTVGQVFRVLSEVDKEGRATRRPLPFKQLVAETGMSEPEVRVVVDRFRSDDCSFLVTSPARVVELGPSVLIDVGHEALLRRWKKISAPILEDHGGGTPSLGWLAAEAKDGRDYQTLLNLLGGSGTSVRSTIPLDQLDERWESWKQLPRTEAWARRYGGRLAEVNRLFENSRKAQERAEAERLERQQSDLEAKLAAERAEQDRRHAKRMRWALMAAMGFAVLAAVAFGFAIKAYDESDTQRQKAQRMAREQVARVIDAPMNQGEMERARFLALAKIQAIAGPGGSMNQAIANDPKLKGWLQEFARAEGLGAILMGAPGRASSDATELLFGAAQPKVLPVITYKGRFVAGVGTTLLPPEVSKRTVQLWETETGASLGTLDETSEPISALAVADDGTLLAVGAEKGELVVWNTSKEPFRKILARRVSNAPKSGLPGDYSASVAPDRISAIALDPMNMRAIVGTGSGAIFVYKLPPADSAGATAAPSDRMTQLQDCTVNKKGPSVMQAGAVRFLAVSQDGRRIIAGFDRNRIGLWSLPPDDPERPSTPSCDFSTDIDEAPTTAAFGPAEGSTVAIIGAKAPYYYVLTETVSSRPNLPRAGESREVAEIDQTSLNASTNTPFSIGKWIALPEWDKRFDSDRTIRAVVYDETMKRFLLVSSLGDAFRKLQTLSRADRGESRNQSGAPDDLVYSIDPRAPTPTELPAPLHLHGFGIFAVDPGGALLVVRSDIDGDEAVQVIALKSGPSVAVDDLEAEPLIEFLLASAPRAMNPEECKEYKSSSGVDARFENSVGGICSEDAESERKPLTQFIDLVKKSPLDAGAWYDLALARARASKPSAASNAQADLDPALFVAAVRGSGPALARLAEWLSPLQEESRESRWFLNELAMLRPGTDSDAYLNWLARAGAPARATIAKHEKELEALAGAGDAAAAFALGILLEHPPAGKKDQHKAFEYFAMAARRFAANHHEFRPAIERRAALARLLEPAEVVAVWEGLVRKEAIPSPVKSSGLPWNDWQPKLDGVDLSSDAALLALALDAFENVKTQIPAGIAPRMIFALLAMARAQLFLEAPDLTEAIGLLQSAQRELEAARDIDADSAPVIDRLRQLARAHAALGVALARRGDAAHALSEFAREIDLLALLGSGGVNKETPPADRSALAQREYGEALLKVGEIERARGEFLRLAATFGARVPGNSKSDRDFLRRFNEALADDLAEVAKRAGSDEVTQAMIASYGRALALLDHDMNFDVEQDGKERRYQEITDGEINSLQTLQAKLLKVAGAPISPQTEAAFEGLVYGFNGAGRRLVALKRMSDAFDFYADAVAIRDWIVKASMARRDAGATEAEKKQARERQQTWMRQIVVGYSWWQRRDTDNPRSQAGVLEFFKVAQRRVESASVNLELAADPNEARRIWYNALGNLWDVGKDLAESDLAAAIPDLIAAYESSAVVLQTDAEFLQDLELSFASARALSRFSYLVGRLVPPSAQVTAGNADIAKCDELVGNPFDQQRNGPGRPLDQISRIDVELAAQKCEAALNRAGSPGEKARLTYELGRAQQFLYDSEKTNARFDAFHASFREAAIGGHVYALLNMALYADEANKDPDAAQLYLEFYRETILLGGRPLAERLLKDIGSAAGTDKTKLTDGVLMLLETAADWGDAESAMRLSVFLTDAARPLRNDREALIYAMIAASLYRESGRESDAKQAEQRAAELRSRLSPEVVTNATNDAGGWHASKLVYPSLNALPVYKSKAPSTRHGLRKKTK